MDDPLPKRKGIALGIERFAPLALAATSVALLYWFSAEVVAKFEPEDGWQAENLYAAVFNWSAIQTGFVFGVYGFVVGKSDGFIREVRETIAMRRFLGYAQRANIGGFLLTIWSLPLTVVNPPVSDENHAVFVSLLIWFGLFVWTFLAFLRIAYSFGHLSSVRDRSEFFGA
jgi:hypothetical protein